MTDKPIPDPITADRAHYAAHPNDEDEWEDMPAPTEVAAKRPAGMMVSVRLSAAEADEIRAAAEEADDSVSGFIRKVVLDRIRNQATQSTAYLPTVAIEVGNFSRVVSHIDLLPGTPVSGGVQSNVGALSGQMP